MPDFWFLLFAASISQGIFLSAAIAVKARFRNPALNLLSLLILGFTLTLAYYLSFWLGQTSSLPSELGLIMQFTFLFGPLLYLYLKSVKKEKTQNDWLHFIPFILVIVAILVFNGSGIQREVGFTLLLIQNIQLISYAIYLLKNEDRKDLYPMVIAYCAYCLSFLSYYILVWTNLLRIEYDYMISASMAVFIYYIGYRSLYSKQLSTPKSQEKYSNSSLTSNAVEYILKKLDALMIEEKLYTDGSLKLQELADKIDVSVHSLSQAINVGKQQKFNEYLCELRIEEAIRLMLSDTKKELSLISIAFDSGFNNKTSFLNAFKKNTGLSPSRYREKLLVQPHQETPIRFSEK